MGPLFRPEVIEAVAAELGLAGDVVAKIKEQVYRADKDVIKIRADLEAARLELRRLMDEDRTNAAQVMKQVEAVGGLETELRKNRVRLLLSVRELLTPEQRKNLQRVLMEQFGGRGRRSGWDRGGPDSDGGMGTGRGGRGQGGGEGWR